MRLWDEEGWTLVIAGGWTLFENTQYPGDVWEIGFPEREVVLAMVREFLNGDIASLRSQFTG